MLLEDCGEKSDDSEEMLQNESENDLDDIYETEADDNEQARSSELNYKHNEVEGPQASGDDGDCDDEILKISKNPIPAVLMFHDVGYLDFDQTSKLATVPQKLRCEMVSRESELFQNRNIPFAVSAVVVLKRNMRSAHYGMNR